MPPCKWWWQQRYHVKAPQGDCVPGVATPLPPIPPLSTPPPGSPQALSRSDLCLHEDQDEDQEGRDSSCHHHPGRERTGTAQGWDEPCTLIRGGHREPRGHCQLLHGQKEDRTQGHCHSMLGTHGSVCPQCQGSRELGCEQVWGKLVLYPPESYKDPVGERPSPQPPELPGELLWARLPFCPQPPTCSPQES